MSNFLLSFVVLAFFSFHTKASSSCASAFESVDNIFDAAKTGNIRAIQTFHKQGVDINAKDGYGSTPAHEAAFNGHAEVIKVLKDLGADVNAKDGFGNTPFDMAANNGHAEVIRILRELDEGADAHEAAFNGHAEAKC